uniref:response regulator n=1 Tax=uncultured Christiangramia sp. TaxID=503836 RepID=UPI00260FACC5|nr:response regulator [uncultured Christiangramia sp.]
MKDNIHVLIVDDHPLIIKAYRETLDIVFEERSENLKISECLDIDHALSLMENGKFDDIDLVFLDIKLPKSIDDSIISGEDLGIKIRKQYNCKILVSTTFNDNYRIYSIFKSIDPDGFMIKNDLTEKELFAAIKGLLENTPYYSKTVLQLMRTTINQDYYVDEIDRKILYEISIGTKMKNLPKILPLSIAGIEKRKRNLKILFDVEEGGDRGLILAAKEKGFL